MGFKAFAVGVIRVLLEGGSDVVCLVVDLYRGRRRLLVSLGKRLQQQTVGRRATAQVLISYTKIRTLLQPGRALTSGVCAPDQASLQHWLHPALCYALIVSSNLQTNV